MSTVFFRLLARDDKPAALADAVDRLRNGQNCLDAYTVEPDSFRQVPGAPFAYWVSKKVIGLFSELPCMEAVDRNARCGMGTLDDFRFLRTWWEPALGNTARSSNDTENGLKWVPYAKGGEFSRYYSSIPLVVNFENKGKELKEYVAEKVGSASRKIQAESFYYRPGLTWSTRSQRGLSFRTLSEGCIFSVKGSVLFVPPTIRLALLGILNSKIFHALTLLQMAFGSYETGVIQRTPIPELPGEQGAKLGNLARSAVDLKRSLDTSNETSQVFQLPALSYVPGATLAERIAAWRVRMADADRQLAELQREIDDIAFRLYGIEGEDRLAIEAGADTRLDDGGESGDAEEEESDSGTLSDARALVAALMSYGVGGVFGRWDIRLATGERQPHELPDPFAPLPVCSPGMLQGPDGLPLSEPPEGYPFCPDRDGILVDDPDHPDDVVRRIREVFELLWKNRAEAVERESCEILGVGNLRDYVRKPGNGGLWMDHITRYSKSRRKAPIFWLLQSSKKNYALWVYYHRLDKDILFKALLNYVEPKVRLEESRLEPLRAQRAEAGTSGKAAKGLEKQIEKQEAFLSELRDFEAKLRRAADLHLEPDLNDGVVLNIAPLRELVPWKEAKAYWDELLAGKYEWSSIGKQLREKGLVP